MSGSPRWSPDGRTIAFDSNVSGNWDVWLIGAQGGRPVRVTNNSANNFIPSWSHDGRWLYFTSSRSGRNEIWKTRPEGGPDVQVTTGGAFTAVESADGKELYYVRGPADVSELWRMPAGGGSASKVLDSVSGRLFSVTPRGIYFASGSPVMELRYLSFATGSVRSIAPIDGIAHADVSQDERWALYPKVEPTTSNIMLVENFRDR
jgi:Tol biopolymer transport system component